MCKYIFLKTLLLLNNATIFKKETMLERKNNDVDTFEINNEILMKNKDESNHNLWVEKYSPKSYIDLLSDDVRVHFLKLIFQNKILIKKLQIGNK